MLVVLIPCVRPVITVVMATVYLMMMPFCCDCSGGPHSIVMEVGPTAETLNLMGGPLGTVLGSKHVM